MDAGAHDRGHLMEDKKQRGVGRVEGRGQGPGITFKNTLTIFPRSSDFYAVIHKPLGPFHTQTEV